MNSEDNWLEEAPAADVARKRAPNEDFDLQVPEPVIDGPLDVPASAAPRRRSPPVPQQYHPMNFDDGGSRSPEASQQHYAMSADDRSPPARQQSRAMNLDDNGSRSPPPKQGSNGHINGAFRSRSPPAPQKYQGFVFDEAPRAKTLNYDGERTIKKYLGPRDTESIAETEASTASSIRLANFFGLEVFQIVLHNPTTSHRLTKFCQSRFCAENMEFLERVDRFNVLIDELGSTMLDIHKNFLSVNAPSQLNLSNDVLIKMNKDLKSALGSSLPKMESLFASAQANTEDLVFSDIYPRFVRHQLVVSATKALAADRSKYAGLGDCFVLTNPAKADNPIVFASDGFVSVTGYTRRDIIPRNCRFLQGKHTDREAVGRLKMSIENREESVELLLNYKKNKEPFWNLLYTAPLYDENGNVAFFIGGQINCSTTIHSASDILKVLSYSDDIEDEQEPAERPVARRSTFGKGFFKSFRGDSTSEINGNKEVGMENALLTKIDKLTIKKQMESFHSAYSKVRSLTHSSSHTCPIACAFTTSSSTSL